MWLTMWRARRARRFPFFTSASSCVSRMRTSASSGATKNTLSNTNSASASTFQPSCMRASRFMSQFHLAKNHLQNIGKSHHASFPAVTAQHDGKTLSAALHALKRNLQPRIFLQIQRRLYEISGALFTREVVAVDQRIQVQNTGDAALAILGFPDR